MIPRSGDQFRLRPRPLGAAVALHELKMLHRAVAVVVPAAEVEVWHDYFLVHLVELPGAPVRVLKPVFGVLRQPRR